PRTRQAWSRPRQPARTSASIPLPASAPPRVKCPPFATSPYRMASPVVAPASPDDVAALCRGLQAFNRPHVGEVPVVPVNLAVRAADGSRRGGILAEVALEWLEIHVLWVEPAARHQGLGAVLVEQCERQAMALGAHSARLDTFDWQAEAFYAARLP